MSKRNARHMQLFDNKTATRILKRIGYSFDDPNISPYDLPEFVTSHYDGSENKLTVALGYITAEPLSELDTGESRVRLMLGKKSGRIYRVIVRGPEDKAKFDFRSAVLHALQDRVNKLDTTPDSTEEFNAKVVKAVLEDTEYPLSDFGDSTRRVAS